MKEFNEVYRNRYFTVEELAKGVYAVIASEEGGAVG